MVTQGRWRFTRWKCHDAQPLTDWKLFQSNTDFAPVRTPISADGYFVRTDATIPAEWAGKSIYLELASSTVGPCLIAINGRPIALTGSYGHPMGGVSQTNISMLAKPGQSNQIEIWFHGSVPFGYEPLPKSKITLEKATLGVVEPH